ncbi:type II secretion system protein [Candidatus Venteria ishoeyi]|uniref:PulJ/GspJ family protein n=1 Tax=Candidatus Venteria ishoeyi TaxID=1899563 RepID=UPI0025A5802A|nr:type II secretion system protein [Candidatus Venteria ishoeyi]MDM8547800.1 type II secretion system protein [Candidatus Venteria ishoeyi]
MKNLPSAQTGTQGFTLLEVLVALTIVGLVLGSIMAISGSSKRLAWRAIEGLERSIDERAAINVGQAERKTDYPETHASNKTDLALQTEDYLKAPPRQTKKILYVLEPYYLGKTSQDVGQLRALRWKRLKSIPSQ